MSMAISALSTPLTSMDQLVDYMKVGEKAEDNLRIGVEHEKFLVDAKTEMPLPYAGQKSIHAVLTALQDYCWEPVTDDGNLIGLRRKGASISLEPGGQFELSGATLDTADQVETELKCHLAELKPILERLGVKIMWKGLHPTAKREDMADVPKSRYGIMKKYMPKMGHLGLDMMLRTCAIQVNLDYTSEQDMVNKMRVGYALTPIIMAHFANSPAHDYEGYRNHIWQHTDPDRSGLLDFVFSDAMGYEAYVNYALDVPMYFLVREGEYIDVAGTVFRDFFDRKVLTDYEPTMADWENHLTTLFPEVRAKQFIEIRAADSGEPAKIIGFSRFLYDMFYKAENLEALIEMVDSLDFSYEDLEQAFVSVPKLGFKANYMGKPIGELLWSEKLAMYLSAEEFESPVTKYSCC